MGENLSSLLTPKLFSPSCHHLSCYQASKSSGLLWSPLAHPLQSFGGVLPIRTLLSFSLPNPFLGPWPQACIRPPAPPLCTHLSSSNLSLPLPTWGLEQSSKHRDSDAVLPACPCNRLFYHSPFIPSLCPWASLCSQVFVQAYASSYTLRIISPREASQIHPTEPFLNSRPVGMPTPVSVELPRPFVLSQGLPCVGHLCNCWNRCCLQVLIPCLF